MSKIAELRKKLQELEDKKKRPSRGKSVTFPFWDMSPDETTRVRLLLDGDAANDWPWREKQMINLPFSGVLGGDENKEFTVAVPCTDMYTEYSCPIVRETKPWWDSPETEDLAKKYWKQRTFYYQGFVVDSTVNEEEVPENPIRVFGFRNKLHTLIKQSILDPNLGIDPFDYEDGTDFFIKKTQPGKYASYDSSTWDRKESPLSVEQLSAIEEHGLFNLGDFIPKEPTAEAKAAIFEMFEASVNGELYDPARWSSFYRPWGMDEVKSNTTTSIPAAAATPVAPVANPVTETASLDSSATEEAEVTTAPASKSAQDILDMIRKG